MDLVSSNLTFDKSYWSNSTCGLPSHTQIADLYLHQQIISFLLRIVPGDRVASNESNEPPVTTPLTCMQSPIFSPALSTASKLSTFLNRKPSSAYLTLDLSSLKHHNDDFLWQSLLYPPSWLTGTRRSNRSMNETHQEVRKKARKLNVKQRTTHMRKRQAGTKMSLMMSK